MRRAFVTGLLGQDGAFIARHLLDHGYVVYGLVRRQSQPNYSNLRTLGVLQNPGLEIVQGDLIDGSSLERLIRNIRPDEIYNLGAQSHVRISFDEPIHTTLVDYVGVLNLLEVLRKLPAGSTRMYQAGTSEMFGASAPPQNEQTPFHPQSPYAVAKLAAYWSVKNYREGYGLYCCTGILYNHESELRGPEFVTRKITKYVADLACTKFGTWGAPLELGNLGARRDWGHAEDYVRAMWQMLQQDHPDDYVVGTGEMHTVREFVEAAFATAFPESHIMWFGEGDKEFGKLVGDHDDVVVVCVNPKFYRPLEVHALQADTTKIGRALGWKPQVAFADLARRMVIHDIGLKKSEKSA